MQECYHYTNPRWWSETGIEPVFYAQPPQVVGGEGVEPPSPAPEDKQYPSVCHIKLIHNSSARYVYQFRHHMSDGIRTHTFGIHPNR